MVADFCILTFSLFYLVSVFWKVQIIIIILKNIIVLIIIRVF